jgi:hypothetical protein
MADPMFVINVYTSENMRLVLSEWAYEQDASVSAEDVY